jgi:hypothetical protein|tara:strand:+ start:1270 stop:1869 length:600 start_codon:yes stop_codon:yes gene_type:complete
MATNTYQQSMLNKSRADKFLLVFDIPPILKTFNSNWVEEPDNQSIISDTVQFSIFGTTVPEITVAAVDNRYAGSTYYVSSHSKNPYPPVSVKFNVDNEYKNYWVMYQWLNLLHNEKSGIYNAREIDALGGGVSLPLDQYQTNLTVYGKDEFNNNRIKFTYTKAFPTTIETIEYNYQAANEISSGFTFVYSQLHTEVINF